LVCTSRYFSQLLIDPADNELAHGDKLVPVMSTNLKAGNVKTVQGTDVMVGTMGGATVNDAKVVAADVAADNGVIHAIDTVLMPK
jgi:uncharacterized surface protein with fasciclin (FAS1) repeats